MEANELKYSKKIFAFLDILGFENLVNESRSNPELISKIAMTLSDSKKIAYSSINTNLTVLKVNTAKYNFRMFSDTNVISGAYLSHDDLVFLSWWIMFYQYFMWKKQGVFIRGAIVYGDIYEDKDIIFGPALIDAYHLEGGDGKNEWPRVLIGKSLLDKTTQAEVKRDFLEFMRQDNENLVYLDYLRELLHLFTVAENERLIGKRTQDYGLPTRLFDEHKEAILRQVNNIKKLKDKVQGIKILKKYMRLSQYHNSTIEELRQGIEDVKNNNDLVTEFLNDLVQSFKAEKLGQPYTRRYSVEEHPEQSKILNILGMVTNRIIEKPPADILKTHGIVIVGETYTTELEKAVRAIARQIPMELSILDITLQKAVINIDNLN